MKFAYISCIALLLAFAMTAHAGVQAGKPAPEVTLRGLVSDDELRLSDLRGKIVYLDFWASWCGPCRQSLPQLNLLRNELASDVEIFAINLDENRDSGINFIEKYPVDYPLLWDPDGKYPEIFGVMGMPTSYIIDRNGYVRYIHQGFRDGDMEKVRVIISKLMQEE